MASPGTLNADTCAATPDGAAGNVVPFPAAARFQLRGWSGGYAIYDREDLIATFHGPQIDLAWATVQRLREGARQEARA